MTLGAALLISAVLVVGALGGAAQWSDEMVHLGGVSTFAGRLPYFVEATSIVLVPWKFNFSLVLVDSRANRVMMLSFPAGVEAHQRSLSLAVYEPLAGGSAGKTDFTTVVHRLSLRLNRPFGVVFAGPQASRWSQLIVSDSLNHCLIGVSLLTSRCDLVAGTTIRGDVDDATGRKRAQFDTPQQLLVTDDVGGSGYVTVISDRGNCKLKLMTVNGVATILGRGCSIPPTKSFPIAAINASIGLVAAIADDAKHSRLLISALTTLDSVLVLDQKTGLLHRMLVEEGRISIIVGASFPVEFDRLLIVLRNDRGIGLAEGYASLGPVPNSSSLTTLRDTASPEVRRLMTSASTCSMLEQDVSSSISLFCAIDQAGAIIAADAVLTRTDDGRSLQGTMEATVLLRETFKSDGDLDKIVENRLDADFKAPTGMSLDPVDGTLYFVDELGTVVRAITTDGRVLIIAGSVRGYFDAADPMSAAFSQPCGIAVLPDRRLAVADRKNNVIRIVDPATGVATLAGTGIASFNDASNPKEAMFSSPTDVVVLQNTLFVADESNQALRAISLTDLAVTTVAGLISSSPTQFQDGPRLSATFMMPTRVASRRDGSLLIADVTGGAVRVFDGDRIQTLIISTASPVFRGTPSSMLGNPVVIARLLSPYGVCEAPDGTIVVSDVATNTIFLVFSNRSYVSVGESGGLSGFRDADDAADAMFDNPSDVLAVPDGILVADTNNRRIRKISVKWGVPTSSGAAGGRTQTLAPTRSPSLTRLKGSNSFSRSETHSQSLLPPALSSCSSPRPLNVVVWVIALSIFVGLSLLAKLPFALGLLRIALLSPRLFGCVALETNKLAFVVHVALSLSIFAVACGGCAACAKNRVNELKGRFVFRSLWLLWVTSSSAATFAASLSATTVWLSTERHREFGLLWALLLLFAFNAAQIVFFLTDALGLRDTSKILTRAAHLLRRDFHVQSITEGDRVELRPCIAHVLLTVAVSLLAPIVLKTQIAPLSIAFVVTNVILSFATETWQNATNFDIAAATLIAQPLLGCQAIATIAMQSESNFDDSQSSLEIAALAATSILASSQGIVAVRFWRANSSVAAKASDEADLSPALTQPMLNVHCSEVEMQNPL